MKLKTLAVAFALCFGSLVGVSVVATVNTYAECKCPAGSYKGEGASCTSLAECNIPDDAPGMEKPLIERAIDIINAIVGVVSILAVIVIVIGAILFVTSTGEAAKTTRARNTILYGVIGLVISLLAFAIVNFVSGAVFKSGSGGGSGSGDSSEDSGGSSSQGTGQNRADQYDR